MKKQSFILTILLLSSMIILNSSTFSMTANPSDVLITEVLYDTPGTDSIDEWIELYNPTGSAIDITADGYVHNPSLNNETTESYYRRR
jgi:hypothetical protein